MLAKAAIALVLLVGTASTGPAAPMHVQKSALAPGLMSTLALSVGSLRCRSTSGVRGKPDSPRTSRKRRE